MGVKRDGPFWLVDMELDGRRRRERFHRRDYPKQSDAVRALLEGRRDKGKSPAPISREGRGADVPALALPPPPPPPVGPTVREEIERWLRESVDLKNSERERIQKRRTLDNRILPMLGDVPLADMTVARVSGWFAAMARTGQKAGTVNQWRACLSAFCSWCVKRGLLEKNPVNAVDKARDHAPREVGAVLTPEEERALLDYLHARPGPWFAMVLSALRLALRPSEVLAMHAEDFDPQTATFRVCRALDVGGAVKTTKGHKATTLPVADDLAPVLAEASATRGGRGPLWTREDGRCLSYDQLHLVLSRAWEALGTAPERAAALTAQSFRRTALTRLAEAGAASFDVRAFARHSSVTTTEKHYVAASAQRLRPLLPGGASVQEARTPAQAEQAD